MTAPRLAGPYRDRAVLARYRGRCEACGRRIEVGSLIERDGREWVHADCRRDRDEAARVIGFTRIGSAVADAIDELGNDAAPSRGRGGGRGGDRR